MGLCENSNDSWSSINARNLGISWVAEQLLAPQEGLILMELGIQFPLFMVIPT